MNFTQFNLDARLHAGISRAGYAEPTRIQLVAIPPALEGRDLIGTAQTGTGKTAAFVLPILHRLLSNPRKGTRAIIITPTRELAAQIHAAISMLGSGTKIRSATVYGGVGAGPQIKALRSGVDILVACPGRLLDLLNQGHGRLDNVDMLVLDEGDRMLDMGFLPDVRRILKYLPVRRQTMLFSATFPQKIEQLARQTLNRPQRVSVGLSGPVETVSHSLYPVTQHLKTRLLLALLKQTRTESVLIFARTKHRAKRLAREIEQAGFKVTSLHGNRTQGQRQSALNGFKTGVYQIMVATDIAARGLDVESITHVVNYDMPDTADAYIHRIGRTGRAERSGDALTLVTPEDAAMVRTLERIMDEPLSRISLAGFDYGAPAPPRMKSANGNIRGGTKKRKAPSPRRPSSLERGRRAQRRRRTAPA